MTAKVLVPRWFIIVHHERPELYKDLRRNFEGDGRVRVILDRRRAERRAEGQPVDAGRRRQPRRKPLKRHEQDLWETAGFRLYYRNEDMRVYEASGKPPRRGGRRTNKESGSRPRPARGGR